MEVLDVLITLKPFVFAVHTIVAVLLIAIIMVQPSKGPVGSVFGGGGQTILGATGATTLLTKLTAVFAALFATTSICLATISKHEPNRSSADAVKDEAPATGATDAVPPTAKEAPAATTPTEPPPAVPSNP